MNEPPPGIGGPGGPLLTNLTASSTPSPLVNTNLSDVALISQQQNSALGDFYRRMRAKLGAPKAITATAHKLARIIFQFVTTRQEFDDSRFASDQADFPALVPKLASISVPRQPFFCP